jgi:predicted RNase H-like HicB family nuclease
VTTIYQATITREDGWWMIHVPDIDGLTQARRLADVEQMARELIAVTRDVPVDDIAVNVSIDAVAGIQVRDVLDAVAAERAEAKRLDADASAKTAALAQQLVGKGIPQRDIGKILGVSHQRVSQLVQN